jgi:very-short-patch-repair endonuclease
MQLKELGFGSDAIKHRVAKGRLHPVMRGVYAVGRPQITREGRWMAAVLSCGPDAVLSHLSAAVHYGMLRREGPKIEVSIRSRSHRKRPGITVHRRNQLSVGKVTKQRGIPVTTPATTIIDLAPRLSRDRLEAAINEADVLGLIDPERLRRATDEHTGMPGAAVLRTLLDRRTFRLTRSKLERLFLPIAAAAGLPVPLTRQIVNGYEVDFYWPELRLVVETDGLTYHRTPAQQKKDHLRDQAHFRAGLLAIRFSHDQIAHDPADVERTLVAATRAGTSSASARTAAPTRAPAAPTWWASTGT